MNVYFDLFITFAKVGAFTFGGGYAMLPMLSREVVEKRNWVTEEELLDYYAIGRCTPGVIAVNAATFIGMKQKGLIGGICSTLGLIFPSVIIVSFFATAADFFSSSEVFAGAMKGVGAAVCAMLTLSVFQLSRKSVVDVVGLIILIMSFFLSVIFDASPVLIAFLSAIAGIFSRVFVSYKK